MSFSNRLAVAATVVVLSAVWARAAGDELPPQAIVSDLSVDVAPGLPPYEGMCFSAPATEVAAAGALEP
jgi:hypothetical protein